MVDDYFPFGSSSVFFLCARFSLLLSSILFPANKFLYTHYAEIPADKICLATGWLVEKQLV